MCRFLLANGADVDYVGNMKHVWDNFSNHPGLGSCRSFPSFHVGGQGLTEG
jgi:hypothetical protein